MSTALSTIKMIYFQHNSEYYNNTHGSTLVDLLVCSNWEKKKKTFPLINTLSQFGFVLFFQFLQ